MRAPTRWIVAALLLGVATPLHAGGLSLVEVQTEGSGGVDGIGGGTAVALSPDGAHVYVTGRDDNAVAVFSRNSGTGGLTFVELQRDGVGGVDGLAGASGVAVSPDGGHVYVTGAQDNAVAVFSRNGGTGALTFVEVERDGVGGVDGLSNASAVIVSPDGLHVYATGQDDAAVAVFSRNGGTGALTFVQVQKDGVAGVTGIRRPRALTLSPDGANLYVAGEGSDAVAVFTRNAGTGALTFLESHADSPTSPGLAGAFDVAVSANGATVYVAGENDKAVVAFARNGGTGALTFLAFVKRGGEVKGLNGPGAIALSPDGAYAYTVDVNRDRLTVLRRTPASPLALTFLEEQEPPNLAGASAIALSADGAHVYAVARNSVVVLKTDSCGNGNRGPDEQCDDGNVAGGDGCSPTCRLELCAPTLMSGCRLSEPGRSKLSIKDKTGGNRDKFEWNFRGQATSVIEFGNPTSSASYVICLYDASGNLQPILNLDAPAGTAWEPKSTGYVYKSKLLTPDGLTAATLREGAEDGKTQVRFKGQRTNLLLPPGLPLVAPVVVQVRNTDTSVCWEATYTTITVVPGTNGSSSIKEFDN
jgi:cysteine-rich repeat protein